MKNARLDAKTIWAFRERLTQADDLDLDLTVTGFSTGELDTLLGGDNPDDEAHDSDIERGRRKAGFRVDCIVASPSYS